MNEKYKKSRKQGPEKVKDTPKPIKNEKTRERKGTRKETQKVTPKKMENEEKKGDEMKEPQSKAEKMLHQAEMENHFFILIN